MGELLAAVRDGSEPPISGRDHLRTLALVEAAYRSVEQHRAVDTAEILRDFDIH